MIKNLRKKFIIVNMLLILLVLIIVFIALYLTNYQQLKNESYETMRRALEDQRSQSPKFELGQNPPDKPRPYIPVFQVLLDNQGDILYFSNEAEVSYEELQTIVSLALGQNSQLGIIKSFNLRFLSQNTPEGLKIAFADQSYEFSSLRNLVITSFMVGIGALAAFYIISMFLSNWALRPVAKSWEQQKRFVADASHELKTPLTVILANNDILLKHKEDTIESQLKWVNNTGDEAQRMKKLVDELLFLAKSDDSLAIGMNKKLLNFSDLALNCLLHIEPVAYEQAIILESDISADIKLKGDEGQLRQLIMILLDNACKYTEPAGTITVKADTLSDKARLRVSNTGNHIPKEDIAHIFDRFYRVDKSRSKVGYGLGLSIAKNITENHNGKISAESDPLNGTTFSVTLPL